MFRTSAGSLDDSIVMEPIRNFVQSHGSLDVWDVALISLGEVARSSGSNDAYQNALRKQLEMTQGLHYEENAQRMEYSSMSSSESSGIVPGQAGGGTEIENALQRSGLLSPIRDSITSNNNLTPFDLVTISLYSLSMKAGQFHEYKEAVRRNARIASTQLSQMQIGTPEEVYETTDYTAFINVPFNASQGSVQAEAGTARRQSELELALQNSGILNTVQERLNQGTLTSQWDILLVSLKEISRRTETSPQFNQAIEYQRRAYSSSGSDEVDMRGDN